MSKLYGSRLLELVEIESNSHMICIFLVSLVALIYFYWFKHDGRFRACWDAHSYCTELDVGTKVTISLFIWSNCAS